LAQASLSHYAPPDISSQIAILKPLQSGTQLLCRGY